MTQKFAKIRLDKDLKINLIYLSFYHHLTNSFFIENKRLQINAKILCSSLHFFFYLLMACQMTSSLFNSNVLWCEIVFIFSLNWWGFVNDVSLQMYISYFDYSRMWLYFFLFAQLSISYYKKTSSAFNNSRINDLKTN